MFDRQDLDSIIIRYRCRLRPYEFALGDKYGYRKNSQIQDLISRLLSHRFIHCIIVKEKAHDWCHTTQSYIVALVCLDFRIDHDERETKNCRL
jgi:hypothetical protein